MKFPITLITAALLAGITLMNLPAAGADLPKDPAVWPNAWSRANSDEWLAQNHDKIKTLKPRVLVLLFANNKTKAQAMEQVERQIAIFAESSRYHGYKDPDAPAALQYRIAKFVDLTDRPDPRPEGERLDGNSTKYLRFPEANRRRNWGDFRYADLYTQWFAREIGYRDPKNRDRYLTLEDLVNAGEVHEVWMLLRHGDLGIPFEGIELKQVYDEQYRKVPGAFRQAGNGGTEAQPWIGRSLRIMFMNTDRGPGCFLESMAHCIEHIGTSRAIPGFSRPFNEFANLDWDERYGIRSHSLYGHSNDPIEYPDPSTITFKDRGREFKIENYDAKGGNVHFNPTGRKDYDLDNPQEVYSSIEHFGLKDGPDGKDLKELWSVNRFAKYRAFANDCMGPWLVYWYQNFPGYQNKATDADGKPIRNWWPFLYY